MGALPLPCLNTTLKARWEELIGRKLRSASFRPMLESTRCLLKNGFMELLLE